MATYGLEAKTANDTFIIDGSSSNYRSLQPQAETSVNDGDSVSIAAGELFFGRKTSGSGSVSANGTTLKGSNVRVFKATPANSFSTPSTEYGLRVLNQSGTVAYDSRNSSHGFEIVNIWAPGQLSGKRSGIQAGTSADKTTGDILYSGSNIHDYSILLNGSVHQQTAGYPSTQFSSLFIWNGANYDTTNNRITWIGFASVNWFGALQGGAVQNLQSVILAKYID